MKIRKNDIVLLPDGSEGKVMAKVLTEHMTVYKIRRSETVEYFEEDKLRLKKRHPFNAILCFFSQ
jgi:hypothetical protein